MHRPNGIPPEDEDVLLAVFGMLAQSGAARGPAPSEEELGRYLHGALDEKREGEIRSHVAFDPAVCELAISLADLALGAQQANSDLEDEAVVDASNRFGRRAAVKSVRFWGGISAIAASLLVAVFVFLPENGQGPTTQRVRIVQPQPDASALQAGQTDVGLIRVGFATGDVGGPGSGVTNGNALAGNCQDDCARQVRLRQFGAALRALDGECGDGSAVSSATRSILTGLVSGPGAMTYQPWREFVLDLETAAGHSDEALCKVTAQMVARLKE